MTGFRLAALGVSIPLSVASLWLCRFTSVEVSALSILTSTCWRVSSDGMPSSSMAPKADKNNRWERYGSGKNRRVDLLNQVEKPKQKPGCYARLGRALR